MTRIRIAVVGLGKIAHDQHLPTIAADGNFSLAATVGPQTSGIAGTPHFESLAALFARGPDIDAAVLCTPPQIRYELGSQCIAKRLHVFLEKPPGVTVGEVEALREAAEISGTTLFAGWHSRFASAVEPARTWLAPRRIDRVSVIWREDVRVWHPNQAWIWQPGGLGVFDPGINALSILTHIMPRSFHLRHADLAFPSNRATPIAANLTFSDAAGTALTMDLDWRETGAPTWIIDIKTDVGPIRLAEGGSTLSVLNQTVTGEAQEYPSMYSHFAALIRNQMSDVDVSPLRLIADAFLCGARKIVKPFR
jgi:D-galactose 1-dehydrogenase